MTAFTSNTSGRERRDAYAEKFHIILIMKAISTRASSGKRTRVFFTFMYTRVVTGSNCALGDVVCVCSVCRYVLILLSDQILKSYNKSSLIGAHTAVNLTLK